MWSWDLRCSERAGRKDRPHGFLSVQLRIFCPSRCFPVGRILLCEFWNEAGQILFILLFVVCFYCGEEPSRRIIHPEENKQDSASFIPKFTVKPCGEKSLSPVVRIEQG